MAVNFKGKLAHYISPILGVTEKDLYGLIEVPPNLSFGDYALPCFSFAKFQKRNPSEIAGDFEKLLMQGLSGNPVVKDLRAEGPYVNIFIDRGIFVKEVVKDLFFMQFEGLKEYGKGKTVVIDFSSPNIAKPFGIGHLRSTVIGNSLKKIFSFLGYKTIGINHIGDWGTQFGKLISAFKRWGDEKKLIADPINYLYQLYVKYHSEAERDKGLEDEGRLWFKRLEEKDGEAVRLWNLFRSLSIREFQKIYRRLGVDFDYDTGESFYGDMLLKTIERVKRCNITIESEGALIVPLRDSITPALLVKSDGATLYLTRDLAAAIYRYDKFHFDLSIYVVGSPQSFHFKQLFEVLEKMGEEWAKNCFHAPFGHIRFESGAMSTRRGNIIFLEDVIERAISLAINIIEEKNPSLPNKEDVAEAIGVGSIIFNDLKNYRIKDITFDWDEILKFDGETGVYLQYTYARINSLLKKFDEKYGKVKFREELDFTEEGYQIVNLLNQFEIAIMQAAKDFEPSIISRYLLDLASRFNSYYNTYRIITEDPLSSTSRACIAFCARKVLNQGLELLGIKAIEEM